MQLFFTVTFLSSSSPLPPQRPHNYRQQAFPKILCNCLYTGNILVFSIPLIKCLWHDFSDSTDESYFRTTKFYKIQSISNVCGYLIEFYCFPLNSFGENVITENILKLLGQWSRTKRNHCLIQVLIQQSSWPSLFPTVHWNSTRFTWIKSNWFLISQSSCSILDHRICFNLDH